MGHCHLKWRALASGLNRILTVQDDLGWECGLMNAHWSQEVYMIGLARNARLETRLAAAQENAEANSRGGACTLMLGDVWGCRKSTSLNDGIDAARQKYEA